jgi:hypothetical protein
MCIPIAKQQFQKRELLLVFLRKHVVEVELQMYADALYLHGLQTQAPTVQAKPSPRPATARQHVLQPVQKLVYIAEMVHVTGRKLVLHVLEIVEIVVEMVLAITEKLVLHVLEIVEIVVLE